jgi:hypothetical protein
MTDAPESGAGGQPPNKADAAFQRGLIERGEAAPVDQKGQLPPGATHEVVGYDTAGQPVLKRRRFSLTWSGGRRGGRFRQSGLGRSILAWGMRMRTWMPLRSGG